MTDSRQSPAPDQRLLVIDALRGAALVAMMSYHLSWDLAYVGFVSWPVTADPGWRAYAAAIAASFLALSGLSLVLAARAGLDAGRYGRRLLKLSIAAAAVSAVTAILFPDGWVFFGILHMIAVGSVLALPLLGAPSLVLLALAAAVVAAPDVLRSTLFDVPLLWPIGLSTVIPASNDYVPILPWFGPVLIGMAIGRLIVTGRLRLPRAGGPLTRRLAVLGRWSLVIYLLHQPILFGAVSGLAVLLPANPALERSRFTAACEAGCAKTSGDARICPRFCGCVAHAMDDTAFWSVRGGDPALGDLLAAAATMCQVPESPAPDQPTPGSGAD